MAYTGLWYAGSIKDPTYASAYRYAEFNTAVPGGDLLLNIPEWTLLLTSRQVYRVPNRE